MRNFEQGENTSMDRRVQNQTETSLCFSESRLGALKQELLHPLDRLIAFDRPIKHMRTIVAGG